jgi:primosomal protein N''
MYSLFDSFFYPRPVVYVVSEERLREAERQQKQVELDSLTRQVEVYEARTQEVVSKAKIRIEELQKELAALPAAA